MPGLLILGGLLCFASGGFFCFTGKTDIHLGFGALLIAFGFVNLGLSAIVDRMDVIADSRKKIKSRLQGNNQIPKQ